MPDAYSRSAFCGVITAHELGVPTSAEDWSVAPNEAFLIVAQDVRTKVVTLVQNTVPYIAFSSLSLKVIEGSCFELLRIVVEQL